MTKTVYVSKWLMPFGYGLTLTPWLILIRKDSIDRIYVEQHELVHVAQWKDIGLFKFPIVYIIELIKKGYKNNKYEVEARELGAERANEMRKRFESACCGEI